MKMESLQIQEHKIKTEYQDDSDSNVVVKDEPDDEKGASGVENSYLYVEIECTPILDYSLNIKKECHESYNSEECNEENPGLLYNLLVDPQKQETEVNREMQQNSNDIFIEIEPVDYSAINRDKDKITEINMDKDLDNQTLQKVFKCLNCGYTSIRNSDLKRHIRTHTGEKPFKCPYCNFATKQSCHLKYHVGVFHKGNKPYKCDYCNFTCTNHVNLRKHIVIHTGQKPYKCQSCEYSFARNSDLTRHTKTHTGDKPFKCQYCNYKCIQSQQMKIHTRIHTGEKPYKCPECNYTCVQKSTLNTHITRKHTRESTFECQYCSRLFKKSGHLMRHIIKTHIEEKPFKYKTGIPEIELQTTECSIKMDNQDETDTNEVVIKNDTDHGSTHSKKRRKLDEKCHYKHEKSNIKKKGNRHSSRLKQRK